MTNNHQKLTKNFLIYFGLFLDIFFITFVLTLHQSQYLKTSFIIDNNDNPVKLEFLNTPTDQSSTLRLNTFINNEIPLTSGHTLGFSIRTTVNNAHFFDTGSDKGGGSIYWPINLVDGKLLTSRLGTVEPTLVDYKINNNRWHRVLISIDEVALTPQNKELKVYIDGILKSRISSTNLLPGNLPNEKWFNFYIKTGEDGKEQINLKDIVFINKSISLSEFNSFSEELKSSKNITDKPIQSFIATLTTLALLVCSLIILIKNKYRDKPILHIIERISSCIILYPVLLFSLWTNYGSKVLFISTLISIYYLLAGYPKLVPESITLLITTPINFLYSLFKPPFDDIKSMSHSLSSIKPFIFFLILVLLIILLYNDFTSFTFIP